MTVGMRGRGDNRDVVVSVQHLRGLAALTVGLSHIAGHPGLTFEIGAAGVDVFFVISGFVMWTVTSRRASEPRHFIIDRLTRIAPLYMLLTVIVYLAAIYVPGAFPNMRTNLTHMILSVLFIPHTDPYGQGFPQVVPGWTLTYEMFFYVIFALGLPAPAHRRIWFYTVAICLLVGIGLLTDSTSEAVKTYTNPLLLEFVAGLWLGVAWETKKLPHAPAGVIAILAGLVAMAAWEISSGKEPTGLRVIVWGVPAATIVAGLLTLEQNDLTFRSRLLMLLGNSSYSIYLTNVFIVAAIWRVSQHLALPVYFIAAIVGSTTAGVVIWHVVERPTTQLLRRWCRRPTIAVVALAKSGRTG